MSKEIRRASGEYCHVLWEPPCTHAKTCMGPTHLIPGEVTWHVREDRHVEHTPIGAPSLSIACRTDIGVSVECKVSRLALVCKRRGEAHKVSSIGHGGIYSAHIVNLLQQLQL